MKCKGYKSLLEAVQKSEENWPNQHRYQDKFDWVIDRVKHYSEKTGLSAESILDTWEEERNYWFMNFYQDANQPMLDADHVVVFEDVGALRTKIGGKGFRCPSCSGVSKSPFTCDTGIETDNGKPCDWKSYGLFGTLGKGIFVFVKSEMKGHHIFKPVALETETSNSL